MEPSLRVLCGSQREDASLVTEKSPGAVIKETSCWRLQALGSWLGHRVALLALFLAGN